LLVGIAAGLATTAGFLSSERPPGAVSYGVWLTWPTRDGNAFDPYSRALFARRGDIAMNPVEGLAFFARVDAAGDKLESRCTYEIAGVFPAARDWTLHVFSPDGSPISLAPQRSGFTASEAVLERGTTRILLSTDPQPGNWLPLPIGEPFVVVLRFYDTPLSAVASVLDARRLPHLVKIRCAS